MLFEALFAKMGHLRLFLSTTDFCRRRKQVVIAEKPDRFLFRSVPIFSKRHQGGKRTPKRVSFRALLEAATGRSIAEASSCAWMNIKRICQIQKSFWKGTESSSPAPHCWGAREETSSLLGERAIFQWEQCGFVFERRRPSRQQEEWPLSSAFDAYDAFDFLTPTLIGRRRLPRRSLIRRDPRPSHTPPRPLTPCRRHQQHHHLCSSLSHYLFRPPQPFTTHNRTHTLAQYLVLPLSAPAVIFSRWLNWLGSLCFTETGVVGAAAGSSQGDEAIESDRMTESRSEARWRESGTDRGCHRNVECPPHWPSGYLMSLSSILATVLLLVSEKGSCLQHAIGRDLIRYLVCRAASGLRA